MGLKIIVFLFSTLGKIILLGIALFAIIVIIATVYQLVEERKSIDDFEEDDYEDYDE